MGTGATNVFELELPELGLDTEDLSVAEQNELVPAFRESQVKCQQAAAQKEPYRWLYLDRRRAREKADHEE